MLQTSEHPTARDNPARKLTTVIIRLPPALVAQIDAFGEGLYLHRSERIRQLLSVGLEQGPGRG
jgi:metal-responsive CopG/Arc/MetJ family transcriptional regulator